MHIRKDCDFENNLKICLSEKIKNDEYAVDVYRALCNMRWRNESIDDTYSCSWRYAGGLVAELRGKGEDYLDFYCSGGEGRVSKEVELDLNDLGWSKLPWEDKEED